MRRREGRRSLWLTECRVRVGSSTTTKTRHTESSSPGSSKRRSAPCRRPRVPPPQGPVGTGWLWSSWDRPLTETPATPSSSQAAPGSAPRMRRGGREGPYGDCRTSVDLWARPLTPTLSCPLTKGRSIAGQAELRCRPASVPGPPQDREQKQSAARARRRGCGSCRSAEEVRRTAPRRRRPYDHGFRRPQGGSAARVWF